MARDSDWQKINGAGGQTRNKNMLQNLECSEILSIFA